MTQRRYRFDGCDAVTDATDQESIVYDDLSARAGEIVARLLNENESLRERNAELGRQIADQKAAADMTRTRAHGLLGGLYGALRHWLEGAENASDPASREVTAQNYEGEISALAQLSIQAHKAYRANPTDDNERRAQKANRVYLSGLFGPWGGKGNPMGIVSKRTLKSPDL